MNRFVIPDIHGNIVKLQHLFSQLNINNDDEFVFLGDYIDRGRNTKEVIEFLINLSRRYKCTFLKGNHELMMFQALIDKGMFDIWIENGGDVTLQSYDTEPRKNQYYYHNFRKYRDTFSHNIPSHHLDFFYELKTYYETEQYFFVHGGVNLTIPFDQNDEDDFLWIRPPFYLGDKPEYPLGKVIVHGHTISNTIIMEDYRIGLDLGAFRRKHIPLIAFTCPGHSIAARGIEYEQNR